MSSPKYYECLTCPPEDGWYWVQDEFEKLFSKEPKLFYVEHFDVHFQMTSVLENAQVVTIDLSNTRIYLDWYGPVQPPEAMMPSSPRQKEQEAVSSE